MRAYRLILMVVAMLAGSTPASALHYYFDRAEKITLPNGEPAELRVLQEDILFRFTRLAVVDAEGRLVGRSETLYSIVLLCQDGDDCKAIDVPTRRVFEPDPRSLRVGPVIPSDRRDASDVMSKAFSAWGGFTVTFGFRARQASLSELLAANVALARTCLSHWLS